MSKKKMRDVRVSSQALRLGMGGDAAEGGVFGLHPVIYKLERIEETSA